MKAAERKPATTAAKQPLPPRLAAAQIPLDTLHDIVFDTNVARFISITDPDQLPAVTALRIWANVQAWQLTGDWPDRRRTAAEIDAEASS